MAKATAMDGTKSKNNGITSYDVAKAAGVSQSAVSRAFAPNASVSKAVRERVFNAAKSLGYVPNKAARSLNLGSADNVGLVLSDFLITSFPRLIQDFTRELQDREKAMLLFSQQAESNVEALMLTALGHQPEGMICTHWVTDRVAQLADAHGVRLVLFNRLPASGQDVQGVHSVRTNWAQGANLLVEHLVTRGARQVMIIKGPDGWPISDARSEALLTGFAQAGVEVVHLFDGDYTYESGQQAARQALAQTNGALGIDAIVGVNDWMAMGAWDTLRFETSYPGATDLIVAGFDDAISASRPSYRLTTVQQPMAEMARAAVEIALAERDDKHAIFDCELVVRR